MKYEIFMVTGKKDILIETKHCFCLYCIIGTLRYLVYEP